MAENKKSVLVYADWENTFEQLSDEEAGKLIKHFFKYINDKNPELNDRLLKIAFEPIKQQLKRDLKKWDNVKKEKSTSGRIGNLKRWNKDLYDKVIEEEIAIDEAENIAKGRTAIKSIAPDRTQSQTVANVAVNDNVNVNVNDIINSNNGEKEFLNENGFLNMPRAEDFGAAPEVTIQSAIEMVKITCQADIENAGVKMMWNIFKNQNLTGKNYYPDKESVYAHFINWIAKKDFKKQSHGNSKIFKPPKNSKNAGTYELLADFKKTVGM